MNAPVRHPAVAGQFYPSNPDKLRQEIETFVQPGREKLSALGCVVPHAGYMYSGHVAGAVYARLELPRRFIILCPNHTGAGQPLAIMSRGRWMTPLGEVAIDEPLAEELKREFSPLREDDVAHSREHALEVQLPFLQQIVHEFTFVPIVVGTGRLEVLTELGSSLARVLKRLAPSTTTLEDPIADGSKHAFLVIASSDMNHYEGDERTRVKDRMAIDQVLALDPAGLWETVQREQISMCGYGTAVAMLTAARELGATKAELVKYATSGDVSGDRDWVVGYAGMIVS
jgi:AmmeMemoRadiSam system protein B